MQPATTEQGCDYFDTADVVLTHDDAMHLFALATLVEHRGLNEQVALLNMSAQLELLPFGVCTEHAQWSWRMTDTDDEWVTDDDRRAALLASGGPGVP